MTRWWENLGVYYDVKNIYMCNKLKSKGQKVYIFSDYKEKYKIQSFTFNEDTHHHIKKGPILQTEGCVPSNIHAKILTLTVIVLG